MKYSFKKSGKPPKCLEPATFKIFKYLAEFKYVVAAKTRDGVHYFFIKKDEKVNAVLQNKCKYCLICVVPKKQSRTK